MLWKPAVQRCKGIVQCNVCMCVCVRQRVLMPPTQAPRNKKKKMKKEREREKRATQEGKKKSIVVCINHAAATGNYGNMS